MERFRRQIYALTVVPDKSRKIFYGLVTSYEFINDCLESEHGDKYIPASERGIYYHGINEVYLATSRDGISYDMES